MRYFLFDWSFNPLYLGSHKLPSGSVLIPTIIHRWRNQKRHKTDDHGKITMLPLAGAQAKCSVFFSRLCLPVKLMSIFPTMYHRIAWRTLLQSELLMQPFEDLCSSHHEQFQTRSFIAQKKFCNLLKRGLKICWKEQCFHLMMNKNCQPGLMVLFFVLEIGTRSMNLSAIRAFNLMTTMIHSPKTFLKINLILLASLMDRVGDIMVLIVGQQ